MSGQGSLYWIFYCAIKFLSKLIQRPPTPPPTYLVEKFKQVALVGWGLDDITKQHASFWLLSCAYTVQWMIFQVNISFSTIRISSNEKAFVTVEEFFVVWSETLFSKSPPPKSKVQKPNTDVSHSVSTDVTHLMRPLDQSSHTPFHLKYHFQNSYQPDEVLRIWRKMIHFFAVPRKWQLTILQCHQRVAEIARKREGTNGILSPNAILSRF